MDKPEILFTPGPTPVPPQVLLAQASPLVYHRGPAYGDLLREVTEGIKVLFQTSNDVLVFASSGSGGLESAVANCFSPGDRVVVPVAGYFGERFAKIARAYGLDVRTIDYEWGKTVRPEDVRAALEEEPAKGILVQQSETSTAVIHDGSQKALSATPGLAFVGVSERAWAASEVATSPRFYFDWREYRASYDLHDPESPWTPAISLVQGLREALRLYLGEGREAVLERHRRLAAAVKEGARALGLDLFGENPERAWAVTAIRAPEGIDGNELVAKVRADHGIILAPGQGPLKGKVFRIGHLGYYDPFDIIRGLAALEVTLGAMGYPVKPGAAVAAAQQVLFAGRSEG
jgi:aspartate aminotransferase-like enzyme